MTYQEVLEYLYSVLPMFQRVGKAAYKADLSKTLYMDRHLGFPHQHFRSIHIAGTNGKGSVAHMLASILQHAGYKTALYTSPHLKDFRERIRINGEMVQEEAVIDFVQRNREFLDDLEPSFFEMTVGLAFDHFAREEVEIGVIETGMGGRLDSTNVINPLVSVITNISLDHTQFLGKDLASIAGEKAGIIKPQIPVVIGEHHPETDPVFREASGKQGAPLYYAEDLFSTGSPFLDLDRKMTFDLQREGQEYMADLATDLTGTYQLKNILNLMTVLEVLKEEGILIKKEAIRQGLSRVRETTGMRGRWETLGSNPRIIADMAHNEAGFRLVTQQIMQTPHRDLHLVLGFVNDKDPGSILNLFPPRANYYYTRASIPRAMDEKELANYGQEAGRDGPSYPKVPEALEAAKEAAGPEDMIYVGGSTFVVAEILD